MVRAVVRPDFANFVCASSIRSASLLSASPWVEAWADSSVPPLTDEGRLFLDPIGLGVRVIGIELQEPGEEYWSSPPG